MQARHSNGNVKLNTTFAEEVTGFNNSSMYDINYDQDEPPAKETVTTTSNPD